MFFSAVQKYGAYHACIAFLMERLQKAWLDLDMLTQLKTLQLCQWARTQSDLWNVQCRRMILCCSTQEPNVHHMTVELISTSCHCRVTQSLSDGYTEAQDFWYTELASRLSSKTTNADLAKEIIPDQGPQTNFAIFLFK